LDTLRFYLSSSYIATEAQVCKQYFHFLFGNGNKGYHVKLTNQNPSLCDVGLGSEPNHVTKLKNLKNVFSLTSQGGRS